MDRPVQLIPLVCAQCSTPIPAEAEEIAWVCKQCGNAVYLDERKGLQPLQVFYAPGIQANTRGLPLWVVDGTVVLQRDTFSGNQTAEANQYWGRSRKFLIPAYACSLEDLLSAGCRLLEKPPVLQPGPAGPFEPVTLPKDDVFAAAEFIVLSIEAGRKDKVRQIRFQLQLSDPVLWILPRA